MCHGKEGGGVPLAFSGTTDNLDSFHVLVLPPLDHKEIEKKKINTEDVGVT